MSGISLARLECRSNRIPRHGATALESSGSFGIAVLFRPVSNSRTACRLEAGTTKLNSVQVLSGVQGVFQKESPPNFPWQLASRFSPAGLFSLNRWDGNDRLVRARRDKSSAF